MIGTRVATAISAKECARQGRPQGAAGMLGVVAVLAVTLCGVTELKAQSPTTQVDYIKPTAPLSGVRYAVVAADSGTVAVGAPFDVVGTVTCSPRFSSEELGSCSKSL